MSLTSLFIIEEGRNEKQMKFKISLQMHTPIGAY